MSKLSVARESTCRMPKTDLKRVNGEVIKRATHPNGIDASKLQHIRRVSFLSVLSVDELAEVVPISRVVHKPRGAMIFMEGDPAESFYVVHRGRVKISMLSSNGKEIIMEIIRPGEFFGELALVDDSPHVTTAESLDDVLLHVYWKESFRNIMSRPDVAWGVARFIGSRLRRTERKVCDLIHKDVSTRIIDLLIEMAGINGENRPDSDNIQVHLNHQDIAGLIGASRQRATIALNALEKLGRIELHRGCIWIKSLHDLRSQQQAAAESHRLLRSP